ncbi:hypothetical protein [Actinophytocola oryzae]|uniref:Uncharacterized protein n=1 Tax=Actinophytocola oryzae TaxID=502181 RepID=A0A4V3FU34_9PSEU|nr:hypothetical protein [Actinophytocola oryzae]TDV53681.1 hypothetical protein CLV71_104149 [Actinophytocola oryzae]
MNNLSQEVVTAEINYRLERARAAALAKEARAATRRDHPSRLRRWLTRPDRTPVRRVTPALP